MQDFNSNNNKTLREFYGRDEAWKDARNNYQEETGKKFDAAPREVQDLYYKKALQHYGLTINRQGYVVSMESKESIKALAEHVKKQVPLCDSIFRYQSEAYFDTFKTAKKLREAGSLPELDWESEEMLGTDIGESVVLENGERVWLDVPYLEESAGEYTYTLEYNGEEQGYSIHKLTITSPEGETKEIADDFTYFDVEGDELQAELESWFHKGMGVADASVNEAQEGMIGEPDSFYDAEERRQAYNDLQDALAQSSKVEAQYVIDGHCPECPNVEDDEDCYGFGNYGCDEGELTYNNDTVSWKEIKDHDERNAQRQQAKANYPGDEKVIKGLANMMKNMDDPRQAYQQMQADYPQMGRAQRSSLIAKAKQMAFPESVEIDQIKKLAGLNELKDERTDIQKIEDLLKDAIGPENSGGDMYELYAELESMDSEKADEVKLIAKEMYNVRLEEGKSPHKKGTKKYKKHMAAMHAEDLEERALKDVEADDIVTVKMGGVDREFIRKGDMWDSTDPKYPMKFKVGSPTHDKLLNIQRKKQMARSTPSAQARRKLKVMASEAVSANMQSMFNDLRIDDNTYITDGNKELTLDEVGPGFYLLGYDRDGRCFEMSKTSKENAKDNITGYGEYKVSDADITDFDGARYYYNDNMPDGGVLNIKKAANEAEYNGKDVKLNKPMRQSGGGKKYKVYVKNPKTGRVKKISFGDAGLKTKSGNKKRAKSFAARHNCEKKNDKMKAGYWACRLPRYGLVKGGKWW